MEAWFNYYYGNIKDSHVRGSVKLSDFFRAIKDPKPKIKQILDEINVAAQKGDESKKTELKTHLPSFTPCVQIRPGGNRCYNDIQAFTGLMVLDFDKIGEKATEFKYFLFNDYDFVIATWLSASKRGVRALVNIPVANSVDEFKSYFHAIKEIEMGEYIGFDRAPQNPVLPLFLSHDPDILFGDTQGIWNFKYTQPELPRRPIQYKFDDITGKAENTIRAAINKIVDNGHPQLRAAAYALGGYVGMDLISEERAIELIDELIDRNAYLNPPPTTSGTRKSEIYKKTARTMIKKGILKPLSL